MSWRIDNQHTTIRSINAIYLAQDARQVLLFHFLFASLDFLGILVRSDSLVAKNVHQILQQRLDGQPTDDPFLLPYGKPANNKLESFSMQFLDSLTLRAKNHLQSSCIKSLQPTPDRLPSPACAGMSLKVMDLYSLISILIFVELLILDTLARIISSMDFDYGAKGFLNLVLRSITSSVQQGSAVEVKEQCYIYLDILCYRLPLLVMPTSERQRICGTILSAMSQPTNSSGIFFLINRYLWLTPLIIVEALQYVLRYVDIICDVVRMLLITLMRALKIMGMDISPDIELFQRINSSYTWPASQLHSLPTAALRTVINPEEDTAKSEVLQLILF
uniref:Mediator of RNA polymerase II transcription subunit 23 n=1 Tax=Heterorhabditis bacteriophora TaxID=37862 RepID=A0A1I7X225_HETBA